MIEVENSDLLVKSVYEISLSKDKLKLLNCEDI